MTELTALLTATHAHALTFAADDQHATLRAVQRLQELRMQPCAPRSGRVQSFIATTHDSLTSTPPSALPLLLGALTDLLIDEGHALTP
ncbi:hypothetical protein [Deinococcus soli (ex Cha et al. 2016)]|uniref:Uncharacterized protein n=2 Tax=Deinococcus soli (ex Cha et al. 2016) TaxID=1309411 RepID=A0AAE4BM87_9DEIO|nr:hypothetical protein [Deinococcus soli (ex Cha et al. 2016)]MDR6218825.1 hypothetical protein [Deinococcus soli (ex Cha et al. 2016)]MDR6328622.1 hypothetical protein [Deinococcus soli (ex Cha et al. 2016)]MDR6751891.1 hypothetical protein [Deinococcus soli (ex Cha et al. 2016)]